MGNKTILLKQLHADIIENTGVSVVADQDIHGRNAEAPIQQSLCELASSCAEVTEEGFTVSSQCTSSQPHGHIMMVRSYCQCLMKRRETLPTAFFCQQDPRIQFPEWLENWSSCDLFLYNIDKYYLFLWLFKVLQTTDSVQWVNMWVLLMWAQ